MPLHDVAGHARAVGAGGVARLADLFRQVEHDRDGQHVVLAGQLDELLAALGLHVGGVDDGEPARGEPLAGDVVQDVEGVTAGALVVLVVGDQPPAEVGGDDLGRLEVPAGERGLARAAGADEDDEGQVGHGQCARGTGHAAFSSFVVPGAVVIVNTAICVGGPTSGSSGPTGTNSTA